MNNIKINPPGHKNYLTKDEEGLNFAKADMEGYQSVGFISYHIGNLKCYIV